MYIIHNNPYRVLGMFANDSTRVQTANIGRMRAFAKVGKAVSFPTDAVPLLGEVSRNQEDVERAKALLDDNLNKAVYAMFWFHRCEDFEENELKDISWDKAKFIMLTPPETDKYEDCEGLLNKAVLALATNKNVEAGRLYAYLMTSQPMLDKLFEQAGIVKDSLPQFALSFFRHLFEEWPSVEWWPIFRDAPTYQSLRRICNLRFIKTVFDELAIQAIRKEVDKYQKMFAAERRQHVLMNLRHCTASSVSILIDREKPQELPPVSPKAQLTLDILAREITQEAWAYYRSVRLSAPETAEWALHQVSYALSLASSSELKAWIEDISNQLQEETQKLPPKSVKIEAEAIQREIGLFCKKADDITAALELVANCAPLLTSVKEKIGDKHVYYLSVSARIMDNALYNANAEWSPIMNGQLLLFEEDKNLLKRAWQLMVNLSLLDVADQKILVRYATFRGRLQKALRDNHILTIAIRPTISLQTESEAYNACTTYADLKRFVEKYPNGKHRQDAINRMKAIEDKELSAAHTIAELLSYKEKYPNSHNNGKVQDALNDLMQNGAFTQMADLRRFLKLFPDNERRFEVMTRMDVVAYMGCSTVFSLQQYLREFPHGIYVAAAKKRIAELSRPKREVPKAASASPKPAGTVKPKITFWQYASKRLLHLGLADKIIALIAAAPVLLSAVIYCCTDISKEAGTPQNQISMVDTTTVSSYDSVATEPTYDSVAASEPEPEEPKIEYERLKTGAKPYANQLGHARQGRNYMTFATKSGNDYVVIVRRAKDGRYMNHTYIRGGDKSTVYLPTGTFIVYFYSGTGGWNPDMLSGNLKGGFSGGGGIMKDGPVTLEEGQYYEYQLYPVAEGNLQLQIADPHDAFK